MVQPVVELGAGNGDAEAARVGEVGRAEAAGLLALTEDDVPLRASYGAPSADAPFPGPADVRIEIGVAPAHLLQHRHGADAGRGLEDRHDLGLPNLSERIGAPPAARRPLLRWQARISL